MGIDQTLLEVIEMRDNKSKYALVGEVGSGKTTSLRERCVYLLNQCRVPGDSILVLLPNNKQIYDWNSFIAEKSSNKIKCHTFLNFVRDEITVFYPLIAEKCSEIVNKNIEAVFLSTDAAIHMISKVIQARREKDGAFSGLVSSNERIAAAIANNLTEAALEGIPASEIACRLFEALYKKDEEKKKIFDDMSRILEDYRCKCFEAGVFDNGLMVEIYYKYIFRDERYRKLLYKRFKHLVVDDLQECSWVELEFLGVLLEQCETFMVSYDEEYGGRKMVHNTAEAIDRFVLSKCNILDMPTCSRESNKLYELADRLYVSIVTGEQIKPISPVPIERHTNAELRSEMLEQIGNRICSLVDEEGYKASDIVVLSTYADIVTEIVIGNILNQKGHRLINVISAQNVSESPLCSSILTFAKLCHPIFRLYPEKHKVRLMLEILFGFDPVTSARIARKACNTIPFPKLPVIDDIKNMTGIDVQKMMKYRFVLKWMEEYSNSDVLDMSSFLQNSLIDIFLTETSNEEEISRVKELIDSADVFCRTANHFTKNPGKDFIEMKEKLSKVYENSISREEKLYGDHVTLTTPLEFLSSPVNKKIVIICSLSSRNWSPVRSRELTNQTVLSDSWKPGEVYTPEREEEDVNSYLASMMRTVIKKCKGKLITFESVLSENGYENDGILPEHFSSLIIGAC